MLHEKHIPGHIHGIRLEIIHEIYKERILCGLAGKVQTKTLIKYLTMRS